MFSFIKYKKPIATSFLVLGLLASCDETEYTIVPAENLIFSNEVTGTVSESSIANTLVAAVNYDSSDTESAVRYELLNESTSGALKLIGNQLMVADPSLIDYETSNELTGQIRISLPDGLATTVDYIVTVTNAIEADGAFITTWETTKANEKITIYTHDEDYTYDYTIDWGDGTTDTSVTGDKAHTYTDAGMHTVSITGIFPAITQITLDNGINARKLKTVEQWGENQWLDFSVAFRSCENLVINDPEAPDLSQVEWMTNMFRDAKHFNSDISHWDVSNIKGMWSAIRGCEDFNQDISTWDVSNITNFSYMFYGCTNFNQDISAWDMSKATNISNMFQNAESFNQDISAWDISNVENIGGMFAGATSFNQDLSAWDTSSVTTMQRMFRQASVFNGDLSAWDVSKVTNFSETFYLAADFNTDISGWDTSGATTMFRMFRQASDFNQDIGAWNTANVTNMQQMFHIATTFNQDLSGWDVSNVTNYTNIFNTATSFDSANFSPLWVN